MSESLKNWGAVIGVLGIIVFFVGLIGQFPVLRWVGFSSIAGSCFLLFFGSFCKILEDSRDSLKRIEELLEKENNKE